MTDTLTILAQAHPLDGVEIVVKWLALGLSLLSVLVSAGVAVVLFLAKRGDSSGASLLVARHDLVIAKIDAVTQKVSAAVDSIGEVKADIAYLRASDRRTAERLVRIETRLGVRDEEASS
jgi:hypothetical protein